MKKMMTYCLIGITVILWPVYGILWKRKERGRCVILAYHHIDGNPCVPYDVSLDRFKYQMEYLHTYCQVVSLDDWLTGSDRLSGRKRNVILTFDDGYESFENHVIPILNKYGFHAHLFIPAGLVDGTGGKEFASPNKNCSGNRLSRKMMSWKQIGKIDEKAVTVGSHTMFHPRLGLIPVDDLKMEIDESKKMIEKKLGRSIRYFAYPFSLRGGRVDGKRESIIRDLLIQSRYTAACTTDMGFNRIGTSPYHLRRMQIFLNDSGFVFRAKIRGAMNWMGAVQKGLRSFDLLVGHKRRQEE